MKRALAAVALLALTAGVAEEVGGLAIQTDRTLEALNRLARAK